MTAHASILVVDDDPGVLASLEMLLKASKLGRIATCSDARQALATIEACQPRVVLLDLRMPGVQGEELLAQVVAEHPEVAPIVITASGELQTAVRCMKLGARDFLTKPVDSTLMIETVRRALNQQDADRRTDQLVRSFFRDAPRNLDAFSEFLTQDRYMHRLFVFIETIAVASGPVLITGETGTGKELIARAIHRVSGRRGPFVAVNTAGLDDTLFSDTLFGHTRGAYTGASGDRKGALAEAAEGTILLDEIGDLDERTQVKLLRVLQEQAFNPLGSDRATRLEARVVAATQAPVSQLRRDLYFRLKSFHVHLPPLRERRDDIPLLAAKFAADAAEDLGQPASQIDGAAMRALARYDFPGNVRELRAIVHQAVANLAAGATTRQAWSLALDATEPSEAGGHSPEHILTEAELRELQRRNILRALDRANWQLGGRYGAAALLGLHPNTLASRMKRFGISRSDPNPGHDFS